MSKTKIEWTALNGQKGFSYNPWWGCTECAPECGRHFSGEGAECYAGSWATRNLHPQYRGVAAKGKWTGLILAAEDDYWHKPFECERQSPGAGVLTCSMSDFWHEGVPLEWQAAALDVMDRTPRLTYLLLTKRPAMASRRLADLKRQLPPNVWFGVTIGHRQSLPLLKPLRGIEASKKFLSNEPLLTPLVPGLDLTGIDWCITGGQSGKGALLCNPDHVRAIRDLCLSRPAAFFHKQWGTWASNPTPRELELADPETKGGATLDGRLWREFPR